jgi:diamine N-acetyltransferase
VEEPIINIIGEKVALGPFRRDLVPLMQRWINDFAALRNLGKVTPQTLEQETEWYDARATGENESSFLIYARIDTDDGGLRPIGTVGLFNINHHNGRADFGILIGEADARGKGHGTEATLLTLDYAFTALGLRNVALTVGEWNIAGQRAYAKAGFREYGRRRQCWPMGGRWWDEVHMDCIASEFTSPVLARIFQPDAPRGAEPR